MKKTTKTEAMPTKKTKFAKYKAIQILADEKIGEIKAKSADLKLQSDDLVSNISKRLNSVGMKKDVRRAAKDLVVKRVDPMIKEIMAIRDNLDPIMKEKFKDSFDANFKSVEQFKKALGQYMKGHDEKQVTAFLGALSQIIAQQDDSRTQQIKAVREDASTVKAAKVVKNPLWKILHTFRPKRMSPEQVAEKMKGEKALFSREGGEVAKKGPKQGFFARKREERKGRAAAGIGMKK